MDPWVLMRAVVVSQLMERYHIRYQDIGRLEVGSESMVDNSKAIKTTLMSLFQESGNHDIEGVDTVNGCYGGTNALFNSIQWIQSDFWDGRYALVVTGDLAVYSSGPARPTGGCGAIAMLIAPNAPLVFTPPRGSFMDHIYDFYKPTLRQSEYPIVDGQYSLSSYMKALHQSYLAFLAKEQRMHERLFSLWEDIDYIVFHSPFCKMVSKAFARLILYDAHYRTDHQLPITPLQQELLSKFGSLDFPTIYSRFEGEPELIGLCQTEMDRRTTMTTIMPSQLGNLYTASLYSSFISLLAHTNLQQGNRILCFSYGSGCASSVFTITVRSQPEEILCYLKTLDERLSSRQEITPEEFVASLSRCEKQREPAFTPQSTTQHLVDGAFYLASVDEKYRRNYSRK